MKREDLIKLIEDNFKEGEEVSFRYSDDMGDVIAKDVVFAVDESEYVSDGRWQLFDEDGKLIHEYTAEEMKKIEGARLARGEQQFWADAKWKMLKSEKVVTKVISVS